MNIPLIGISYTDNNGKLREVLKNTTNITGAKAQGYEDDVFKSEAFKIMKQCSGEHSENYKQNRSGGTKMGNNDYGKNYNFYSNQKNETKNNSYHTNYDSNGYKDNNNNPYDRNNVPYASNHNSDNYNSNRGGGSYSPHSCSVGNENRGLRNYNNDGYENQGSTGYDSYRGRQPDNYYGGADYDRSYYGSRITRSEQKNDNDNQCTSQCIFGYMELLDENRVPSETLVIKWLQGHITNNDIKRIKVLREVRRCFARLSTSDLEDGCEFSNELSKCLNLDIE